MIANIWLLRRLDQVTSFSSNHPLKVVSVPKGLVSFCFVLFLNGWFFLITILVFLVDVLVKIEIGLLLKGHMLSGTYFFKLHLNISLLVTYLY